MKINGLTKTCGLIGCPVEHTLSPMIHNTLAEMTGTNLCYHPFLVEKGDVEAAVQGAEALHIHGLNVTVPHKEAVLPYLAELDPLAEQIGAVNTLVSTERGFKGYNTDMPGLYRAMLSDGVKVDGAQAVILGAGGVARAVAFLLADKANKIYLLNRTVDRAADVAAEVNAYAGREVVHPMALADYWKLRGADYLAIQATCVGMYPDTEKAVIEDAAFYQKVTEGYDLIFNPAETKFMKLVKKAGGNAYNGLKMLLYQGIIAFELWNHVKITDEQAEFVYERLKESL